MPHPARACVGHMAQDTLVPSAARTTSGNGAVTAWWKGRPTATQTRLGVTAASGTSPQLTLFVEESPDQTKWTVRDTYPVQTTTGTVTRALPRFRRSSHASAGQSPAQAHPYFQRPDREGCGFAGMKLAGYRSGWHLRPLPTDHTLGQRAGPMGISQLSVGIWHGVLAPAR